MRQIQWTPTDAHPSLLVGRDEACAELEADVLAFLARRDPEASAMWAVIGDKGTGKTISTRSVLDRVRAERGGDTIIAVVDCRTHRSWREVLAELCWALVVELRARNGARSSPASRALLTEAQLLDELTRLAEADSKTLHERALSYRAGLGLAPRRELLSALRAELGLELQIEERTIRTLRGSRTFDEDRLDHAIHALCRDIRAAGLAVVIYIDNIDELDCGSDMRARARRDANGLLRLAEAPVALVLSMRTYFSRVLPRQMANPPLLLGSRPPAEMLAILDARNRHEDRAVRDAFDEPVARATVTELAGLAPTPLSFLTWVHVLYRWNCLAPAKLDEGFSRYVESTFATLGKRLVLRVMEAFATPATSISRARVLAACEGHESLLHKLEERQVVLPEDFWAPERYTLDPLLQTFHRRLGPSGITRSPVSSISQPRDIQGPGTRRAV